jgi:hypothetical protein
MVAHASNLSYSGGGSRRIVNSRPPQAKLAARPCLKNKIKKQTKGAGGVAQLVDGLPSMHKVLDSIVSTAKDRQIGR